MKFTEVERKEIAKLRTRYPDTRSLTLPLMWMVQKREGYVSDDAVHLIANELNIPPIWVEEVRSWYSMFTKKKEGKYILEICNNLSCAISGSQEIIDYLVDKLKIKVGETTKDGMFSLEIVACLGACSMAPVMTIDGEFYGRLDRKKVQGILNGFRTEESNDE